MDCIAIAISFFDIRVDKKAIEEGNSQNQSLFLEGKLRHYIKL